LQLSRPPETSGCEFVDERLGKRYRKLFEQLSNGLGESIPLACQDWANTKAAYRFFSNPRFGEKEILHGHFQATQQRFAATQGPILILHDTTEFSYKREKPGPIGKTHKVSGRKKPDGRKQLHTICGILMHSSLAVTTDGLPLGISATKMWTRKKFKGCRALRNKVNSTRVPIEKKESFRWIENLRQSTALLGAPERCVHVGDRESDIYEFFCAARDEGTHFLIRACADRLIENGEITVSDKMSEVKVKGLHRIKFRDAQGKWVEALLELRFRKVRVLPSVAKQKRCSTLELTVIYAQERGKPEGRDRIEWKLITDLSVTSRKDAIEKLEWYATRWKIETWHKILKSGCKSEESKLRTAKRLAKLIAVFSILSWRIFWLTMMNRVATPECSASLVFTKTERKLLDRLVPTAKRGKIKQNSKGLSAYATKLARLGGYLARASDPPPGNKVVWRGLSRLTDIELGFTMAMEFVGN
jgi:hypothetical protein